MAKKDPLPTKVRSHGSCCSVTKFEEGNCKVILPARSPEWLCISGSEYQRSHGHKTRLCDLSIFWQRDTCLNLFVAELKGGNADIEHVRQQLQGGADLADALLDSARVVFYPVFVHKSLSTFQYRALDKVTVKFGGRRYRIIPLKCGSKLDIVPEKVAVQRKAVRENK
jgi:hypothetical protein